MGKGAFTWSRNISVRKYILLIAPIRKDLGHFQRSRVGVPNLATNDVHAK